MHRWVVLALVACDTPIEPTIAAPMHWLVPAAPTAWPLGEPRARIGRSVAPAIAPSRSLAAATTTIDTPLVLPMPWTVPGDGPARAVVAGQDRGHWAIELVEIDRGRVAWRDATTCGGPVVGVTSDAIVCSDIRGTRALDLDGKLLWQAERPFLAITNDTLVSEVTATNVSLCDVRTHATCTFVELPKGFTADTVIAACKGDVFTTTADGKLSRIGPAPPKPPHKPIWQVAVGNVAAIDACASDAVVNVTIATDAGPALLALARDTGKQLGRVDGVRGFWPARSDPSRLEIATVAGVARYPRELIANQPLLRLPLGALLSQRGDRRLVRATPMTAVLLDRDGVRAYLPLAELGAALGDNAILAGSWVGSPHATSRLVALPPPWQRPLHVPIEHPAVAVPAELRDLPQAVALDTHGAVALADAARFGVANVALDPGAPALYTTTLEHAPDASGHGGIARFDLARRTWAWHRADGCGTGAPIAIAATRELVACAARGATATVRATHRDGGAAWEWTAANVDAMVAAGDVVVAFDADRAVVLDAASGRPLGMLASDDGAAVRAAAIEAAGTTMVITYEQGRIVARLPRVAMVPAWTIAVDGVVKAVTASQDGVLVALDDGDAYRIDALGTPVALPGLDLAWRAEGDVVVGAGAGGPVPPAHMPAPPTIREVYHAVDLALAPAIATAWPAPPPMAASWQITLYELAGSVRARNDYALVPPITPGVRGTGKSPFVMAAGPVGRELLVIEPDRGDPVRHVLLPDDVQANSAVTFATSVDGRPVVGTILAAPLRVVVF